MLNKTIGKVIQTPGQNMSVILKRHIPFGVSDLYKPTQEKNQIHSKMYRIFIYKPPFTKNVLSLILYHNKKVNTICNIM